MNLDTVAKATIGAIVVAFAAVVGASTVCL